MSSRVADMSMSLSGDSHSGTMRLSEGHTWDASADGYFSDKHTTLQSFVSLVVGEVLDS